MDAAVEVRGWREATAALNAFRDLRLDDLLRRLGSQMVRQHRLRIFSQKTSPDGIKWAPLAPSTAAKKRNPKDILVESGLMGRSFMTVIAGNAVTLSNPTPYAIYHQDGTRRFVKGKRVKRMVKRPFVGISEANMAELLRAINGFADAKVRRFAA